MLYGENSQNYFLKVNKGIGINKQSMLEGIHQNNFFATYLIGPFLILNPLFTLKLIKQMGVEAPELAMEKEVLEAYKVRLQEFKKMS